MKAKTIISIVAMVLMFASTAVADLVMDMPLNNLSAEDVSGNDNHGIKYCPMSEIEGHDGTTGGAMEFDGDMDYIVVPLTATFAVEDEYSLSFWIKRADANGNSFIMYSNNVYLLLSGEDSNYPGRIMFHNVVAYDIPVGVWTHIATTSKANDKRQIFVNGVLVDSSPMTNFESPAMDLAIGARHSPNVTDHEFTGGLDDIKVYNRALTADEVADLAGINNEPEEECVPVSMIPACQVCEEYDYLECDDEKDCKEPTEVYTGGTKRAKLHFNETINMTEVKIFQRINGIPNLEGLREGPAQIRVQIIQGEDVVEFVSDTDFSLRGINLLDQHSTKTFDYIKDLNKKAKERKEKKSKGKSCKK